ncbi:hypothetical protein [Streptomyces lydicus]|uniref:hypothetical protein n=1 Tax=Streptomyces lydicus TaxID=47763 RepID=UPI00344AE044
MVTAYLDRHPGERDALAGLLVALDTGAEPTSRTTRPGHITCSAVVVDRQRRVLHIRHKASGGLLLAPGGHVDADDDTLLATTLRGGRGGGQAGSATTWSNADYSPNSRPGRSAS